VFVIDDIDRLTSEELRELFKVVKALADFPNVVYLLAFDRSVVAEALTVTGINGDDYLEKIVQAPFSLPAVDKLRLRHQLTAKLDKLLNAFDTSRFNQLYWANVYQDGLDQYIEKPRDVVRIVNALSVTYPAVAGEVSAVDFIALEFLRVFQPSLYYAIRDHREMFSGPSTDRRGDEDPLRSFHEKWLNALPDERRASLKALMSRMFPRVGTAFRGMQYGPEWLVEWRRDLRVCCPDISDVYFQFGLSRDLLGRRELDALIAVSEEPNKVIAIFAEAAQVTRPDGSSKASDILERLQDFKEEIKPSAAKGLLLALFTCGDNLLGPGDEEALTPNRWRLEWVVRHLLARVAEEERFDVLRELVMNGTALGLIVEIVDTAEENLEKPEGNRLSEFQTINEDRTSALKELITARLKRLRSTEYLTIADLGFVFHRFSRWAGRDVVVPLVAPLIASDELLPRLLEKYLKFGTRGVMGDRAVERVPLLNPKQLEPIVDIDVLAPRVQTILQRPDLPADQKLAAETFLQSLQRTQEGKDPDKI
jgi:predicted KAP-like P-loop ATPase